MPVRFLKQVAPAVDDLTARRTRASWPVPGGRPAQAGDYPTGAWAAERRAYHVCVEVGPAAVGQEMLAARMGLIASMASGPQTLGQRIVDANLRNATQEISP